MKLRLNNIYEDIDLLTNKQNDRILEIEYDINQLLGNLAAFSMFRNSNTFVPRVLDGQINEINEQ